MWQFGRPAVFHTTAQALLAAGGRFRSSTTARACGLERRRGATPLGEDGTSDELYTVTWSLRWQGSSRGFNEGRLQRLRRLVLWILPGRLRPGSMMSIPIPEFLLGREKHFVG